MNELLEDNFQNSYDYVHNYFMLIVLDVKKKLHAHATLLSLPEILIVC